MYFPSMPKIKICLAIIKIYPKNLMIKIYYICGYIFHYEKGREYDNGAKVDCFKRSNENRRA